MLHLPDASRLVDARPNPPQPETLRNEGVVPDVLEQLAQDEQLFLRGHPSEIVPPGDVKWHGERA